MNITVIPYEDNPNADKLNFTWEATEFTEKYLIIQLNFSNPLYVSFGGNDSISVSVTNQSYFERKAFQEYLPYNYTMSK